MLHLRLSLNGTSQINSPESAEILQQQISSMDQTSVFKGTAKKKVRSLQKNPPPEILCPNQYLLEVIVCHRTMFHCINHSLENYSKSSPRFCSVIFIQIRKKVEEAQKEMPIF